MSNAEIITNKLSEMSNFIAQAEASLQKGKVVNLSHLDGEVAKLCAQSLDLPAEEAKSIQPVMAQMIAKLESFALSLQSFQAHLKEKTK